MDKMPDPGERATEVRKLGFWDDQSDDPISTKFDARKVKV
jgi:hypothetical protein